MLIQVPSRARVVALPTLIPPARHKPQVSRCTLGASAGQVRSSCTANLAFQVASCRCSGTSVEATDAVKPRVMA
jgi:hypothetical protein